MEPSSSYGHLRDKRDRGQSHDKPDSKYAFLGSKLARNVGNKISKFSPVKCNCLVGANLGYIVVAQCSGNTFRNTATSIWLKPKRV